MMKYVVVFKILNVLHDVSSYTCIMRYAWMICVALQATGWSLCKVIEKDNTVFALTINGASVSGGITATLLM